MKMIGRSARSEPMSFCNSRPLISGNDTSSTRQLGELVRERVRNSSADANVSGRQPANSISNSSDSRTEMSSSTTKTIGFGCDFAAPDKASIEILKSTHTKRGVQRLQEIRWLKRLEKT